MAYDLYAIAKSFTATFRKLMTDGSRNISNLFPTIQMRFSIEWIPRYDCPKEATIEGGSEDSTEKMRPETWKRELSTKKRECLLQIDAVDFYKTKGQAEECAEVAARECKKILDQICIEGITGKVGMGNGKYKELDSSNYIAYNGLDTPGATAENEHKLSSYKIMAAAVLMQKKGFTENGSPLICIAPPSQTFSFRKDLTDPINRMGMAETQLGVHEGVHGGFYTNDYLPQNVNSVINDGTMVDHVYVINPSYFMIGYSPVETFIQGINGIDFTLVDGNWAVKGKENIDKELDYTLKMTCNFGFVRLEEDAVIVIECLHDDTLD
jgi:hypothetical protein